MSLKLGDKVILLEAPAGLLRDLPEEDQEAIRAVVGRPVNFGGYEDDKVVLRFIDAEGDRHAIWVAPEIVREA
jgi:hypothetical protein